MILKDCFIGFKILSIYINHISNIRYKYYRTNIKKYENIINDINTLSAALFS